MLAHADDHRGFKVRYVWVNYNEGIGVVLCIIAAMKLYMIGKEANHAAPALSTTGRCNGRAQ